MTDPAACIPPNPSVSGWWYLGHDQKPTMIAKWFVPDPPHHAHWRDLGGHEDQAELGYRILGPVPSHSEVEALRAALEDAHSNNDNLNVEATDLRAENAKLRRALAEAGDQFRDFHEWIICTNANLQEPKQ